MKTQLSIILALGAMMVLGCSIDSQIEQKDAVIEETSASARPEFHEIVFESFGKLQLVDQGDCKERNFDQVLLEGSSRMHDIGKFDMHSRYCTDFKSQRIGAGILKTEKGSELYFSYGEMGEDRLGSWMYYYFEGGTKEFEKAQGELKVYLNEDLKGTSGEYKYHGNGFIWL